VNQIPAQKQVNPTQSQNPISQLLMQKPMITSQQNNNLKDISSKHIAFVRKIGQGQFGDVYEGTLRDNRGMIVIAFCFDLINVKLTYFIEYSSSDSGCFEAPQVGN
jgi:hypothetical protein